MREEERKGKGRYVGDRLVEEQRPGSGGWVVWGAFGERESEVE